jgi:hypothetical protein
LGALLADVPDDRNCCGARDLKDLQFFGAKWDLSEYYSEDPFFFASLPMPGWKGLEGSTMTLWWNWWNLANPLGLGLPPELENCL